MKITITNDGVKGVDAITIFKREGTVTENHTCIEGGDSFDFDWDPETDVRFELVPWIRIPPKT